MDEQEATDKLEELCGGRRKAAILTELWRAANRSGGDRDRRLGLVDVRAIFKARAESWKYSPEAVEHFLQEII